MRDELGEGFGHRLFHRRALALGRFARALGDRLRRADAGDHVLALRVDQELAVERAFAGRGIAREGDAGRRRRPAIAEHHRLHVDGGAPILGDVVEAAIGLRARAHPGAEHGADRAPELLVQIVGERAGRGPSSPSPCRARRCASSRRRRDRCRARRPCPLSRCRGFPRNGRGPSRARRRNTSG